MNFAKSNTESLISRTTDGLELSFLRFFAKGRHHFQRHGSQGEQLFFQMQSLTLLVKRNVLNARPSLSGHREKSIQIIHKIWFANHVTKMHSQQRTPPPPPLPHQLQNRPVQARARQLICIMVGGVWNARKRLVLIRTTLQVLIASRVETHILCNYILSFIKNVL